MNKFLPQPSTKPNESNLIYIKYLQVKNINERPKEKGRIRKKWYWGLMAMHYKQTGDINSQTFCAANHYLWQGHLCYK